MINDEYEEYQFDICEDFTFMLYKLDLFHNRTVKYWYTRDLCTLLVHGKDILNELRDKEAEDWK
jgi:hypothetical protein